MSDITRLVSGYYNARSIDAIANPGGMGNDGHETNFPLALADVGTVAQYVGTQATNAGNSATTATTEAGLAHADRLLCDADVIAAANIAAGITATSTTALAIGTGAHTIFVQTGKQFAPPQWAFVADHASPLTRWMLGQLTGYNSGTGQFDFFVPGNGTLGSGTPAQYDIFLSGPIGATGAQGVTGGAISEDYTFDTGTANANPGAGKMRFNATPESAATAIYISTTDINGGDMTALLDSLAASSSVNKGQLRVANKTDSAKWETCDLLGVIPHTGYREFTIAQPVASPNTSPFGLGDEVILLFTRTGDTGTSGLTMPLLNTSGATLTVNVLYGLDTSAGPVSNALPTSHAVGDTVEAEDEAGYCAQNSATFTTAELINGSPGPFVLNVKRGKVVFAWRGGSIGFRATVKGAQ